MITVTKIRTRSGKYFVMYGDPGPQTIAYCERHGLVVSNWRR